MIGEGKPIRIFDLGVIYPNMPIMVSTDQPDSIDKKIQEALLSLSETDSGQSLLKHIGSKGYRVVDVSEYEILRPYMP